MSLKVGRSKRMTHGKFFVLMHEIQVYWQSAMEKRYLRQRWQLSRMEMPQYPVYLLSSLIPVVGPCLTPRSVDLSALQPSTACRKLQMNSWKILMITHNAYCTSLGITLMSHITIDFSGRLLMSSLLEITSLVKFWSEEWKPVNLVTGNAGL